MPGAVLGPSTMTTIKGQPLFPRPLASHQNIYGLIKKKHNNFYFSVYSDDRDIICTEKWEQGVTIYWNEHDSGNTETMIWGQAPNSSPHVSTGK